MIVGSEAHFAFGTTAIDQAANDFTLSVRVEHQRITGTPVVIGIQLA